MISDGPEPSPPTCPVVEIRFKVQMHEPVAKPVVASRMGLHAPMPDCAAMTTQPSAAHTHGLPIKHQLIAACLGHLRRRGQLIKKENTLPVVGRNLADPFRLTIDNPGSPGDRPVKLHGSARRESRSRDRWRSELRMRLAHAARRPQMCRAHVRRTAHEAPHRVCGFMRFLDWLEMCGCRLTHLVTFSDEFVT